MTRKPFLTLCLTAALFLLSSAAVVACTIYDASLVEKIHSESITAIRTYHALLLASYVAVITFFVIRRLRGWVAVFVSTALIVLSPGWFPMQNAGITPMCEPRYAFEVKFLFGIACACVLSQLYFWYQRSPRRLL